MTDYQPNNTNAQTETSKPYNELELQFLLTQPAWGREATPELAKKLTQAIGDAYFFCPECQNKLSQGYACPYCKDYTGAILVIDKEPLHGTMSYFTRDFRLGNLTGGEVKDGIYWSELSGDLLNTNLPKAHIASMTRVIAPLELSQSKKGMLRRLAASVIQEVWSNADLDPKKKGLVTNKPKRNN